VRHDLARFPHTNRARSELVLEAAENAFDQGAFGETIPFGPGHLFGTPFGFDDSLPGARVGAQGDFALGSAAAQRVIGNGAVA
jgi:hypothetical protein